MGPPARRRSCLKQRNDDETSEITKNIGIPMEAEILMASAARKRVSFSAANQIKEFPKNVSSDTSTMGDSDMELTKFETTMVDPDAEVFLDDEDPMETTRSHNNPNATYCVPQASSEVPVKVNETFVVTDSVPKDHESIPIVYPDLQTRKAENSENLCPTVSETGESLLQPSEATSVVQKKSSEATKASAFSTSKIRFSQLPTEVQADVSIVSPTAQAETEPRNKGKEFSAAAAEKVDFSRVMHPDMSLCNGTLAPTTSSAKNNNDMSITYCASMSITTGRNHRSSRQDMSMTYTNQSCFPNMSDDENDRSPVLPQPSYLKNKRHFTRQYENSTGISSNSPISASPFQRPDMSMTAVQETLGLHEVSKVHKQQTKPGAVSRLDKSQNMEMTYAAPTSPHLDTSQNMEMTYAAPHSAHHDKSQNMEMTYATSPFSHVDKSQIMEMTHAAPVSPYLDKSNMEMTYAARVSPCLDKSNMEMTYAAPPPSRLEKSQNMEMTYAASPSSHLDKSQAMEMTYAASATSRQDLSAVGEDGGEDLSTTFGIVMSRALNDRDETGDFNPYDNSLMDFTGCRNSTRHSVRHNYKNNMSFTVLQPNANSVANNESRNGSTPAYCSQTTTATTVAQSVPRYPSFAASHVTESDNRESRSPFKKKIKSGSEDTQQMSLHQSPEASVVAKATPSVPVSSTAPNPLSNAMWNNQEVYDRGVADQPLKKTNNLRFPLQYAAPRGKTSKFMGIPPASEYMNPAIGPKLFSKCQGVADQKSRDVPKPRVPLISAFGRFGDAKTPKRLIPADIITSRVPVQVANPTAPPVSQTARTSTYTSRKEQIRDELQDGNKTPERSPSPEPTTGEDHEVNPVPAGSLQPPNASEIENRQPEVQTSGGELSAPPKISIAAKKSKGRTGLKYPGHSLADKQTSVENTQPHPPSAVTGFNKYQIYTRAVGPTVPTSSGKAVSPPAAGIETPPSENEIPPAVFSTLRISDPHDSQPSPLKTLRTIEVSKTPVVPPKIATAEKLSEESPAKITQRKVAPMLEPTEPHVRSKIRSGPPTGHLTAEKLIPSSTIAITDCETANALETIPSTNETPRKVEPVGISNAAPISHQPVPRAHALERLRTEQLQHESCASPQPILSVRAEPVPASPTWNPSISCPPNTTIGFGTSHAESISADSPEAVQLDENYSGDDMDMTFEQTYVPEPEKPAPIPQSVPVQTTDQATKGAVLEEKQRDRVFQLPRNEITTESNPIKTSSVAPKPSNPIPVRNPSAVFAVPPAPKPQSLVKIPTLPSTAHPFPHVKKERRMEVHEACLDDTAQPDFANISCDFTFGQSNDETTRIPPPERPTALLRIGNAPSSSENVPDVSLFETTRASLFQSSFLSPSSPPPSIQEVPVVDYTPAPRSAYIQGLIHIVKTARGRKKVVALDELWRNPQLTEPWDNVKEEIECYVHPCYFSEDHRW